MAPSRSRSTSRTGGAPKSLLYSRVKCVRLTNPAREALPKLGILCSFSLDQVREMTATGHPLFSELSGPEWRFVELPTGHYPMLSRPDDLTDVLLGLAPSAVDRGTNPRE